VKPDQQTHVNHCLHLYLLFSIIIIRRR